MIEVLLDSLWQGAFVVAIAAGIAAFVPQRHAATRYTVWFVALFALAILPIASRFSLGEPSLAIPSSVIHSTNVASQVTEAAASSLGFWLAAAWAAGIALNFVRLALSYRRVARIVRSATPSAELGIGVRTSSSISIPIAAGILRPVIVLPDDLAARLEPVDLRGIVAHERAHITRNDILGNLIQRLFESIFFFNPWVYVIGRQLVNEREAACDDWAVENVSDPDRYATCLVSLAQRNPHARTTLLSPSAIGSGRMLARRIVRLLNGKAVTVKINYFVPAAAVALFALLALAFQSTTLASPSGSVATNGSSSASCSSNVEILKPAAPNIPESLAKAHPNGEVKLLVTVTKNGNASDVKILKSSGNADIDEAVVDAASHSTYKPEIRNCMAVSGGQYVFRTTFGP
jgi:bla regulator protein BlaR1